MTDYNDFLKALLDATDDGSITWHAPHGGGEVQAEIGKYVVRMDAKKSAFGDDLDYTFSVVDLDGVTRDRFTDEDVMGELPVGAERNRVYREMMRLHRAAARQANRTDSAALDEIVGILRQRVG